MLQLSKGLNPFGVREVSKQLGLRPTRPMHCLNPFGVREVSKQSYDEMNDDFIQFDSDMSHVDLDDLFDLADSITVPEPHIINEMWEYPEEYSKQDIAECLRDNWHEIKGLVSLTDRDKMSDFAFDNHFE